MGQPERQTDGVRHVYHATASANRQSILEHGLDASSMGLASGIAGSVLPEADGIYMCETVEEAWWFASFGRVRPVDIWSVDVSGLDIEETGSGYSLCRGAITPDRLELVEADLDPNEAARRVGIGQTGGLKGRMTIVFKRARKSGTDYAP